MKYFYRSLVYSMQPERAGLGAIMVSLISCCQIFYDLYQNTDLLIEIPEVNLLFNTPYIKDSSEYTNDFEAYSLSKPSKYFNDWNIEFQFKDGKKIGYDLERTIQKHKIFNKFFSFKDILDYDKLKNVLINDNTLGVHIRGTDKYYEVQRPDPKDIILKIESILEENPNIDNIFLATDESLFVYLLNNYFKSYIRPIKINSITDKVISFNGKPIHFVKDRTKINRELITDIYLLANSKYFLYSISNVSFLSLIIGGENFKKTYCINT